MMSDMQTPKELNLPRYVEWVYTHSGVQKTLYAFSFASVILTVLAFVCAGVYLAVSSWLSLLLYAITLFIPFVLVSVMRVWIDAKRPCLVYRSQGFDLPSKKQSRSMPSRHVFSAFSIGVSICFFHWPLGAFVLLLGTLLALGRVLLAIHFARDVLVGAGIGILSGVVSGLIINNSLF